MTGRIQLTPPSLQLERHTPQPIRLSLTDLMVIIDTLAGSLTILNDGIRFKYNDDTRRLLLGKIFQQTRSGAVQLVITEKAEE